MKHMKKALLLGAVCCLALVGCGKSDDAVTGDIQTTEATVNEETTTDETASTGETTVSRLADGRNPLTGEAMDSAIASQRPVTVMIGNTTDAMPQYGTSNADIIYEVPVEGGLTRLMGIYQDYANLPTIMSVRSCRHYYAYLSEEYNAIYVHYGQAIYATEMLNGVDDLNGLDGDLADVTFFRDSSRKAPHNAYINGESIIAGIQKRGYDTKLSDSYQGHFNFVGDGGSADLSSGEDCKVFAPGYVINKPWFVYNEDDGLYYRNQYKSKHVDGADNTQLAYKNIIMQVCDYAVEPDGTYLDVRTAANNAEGMYISDGKAMKITWTKDSETGVPTYYDANGNELAINQGKTFVCLVLNDAVGKVGVYATEEDYEASK